jgi:RNA polymerase sigma factor (sigma-70 family)
VKDAHLTPERERELLVAVGRGDVSSLRELYRSFERPLYALGIRWYDDTELAEELVQEVTLRVWRKSSGYEPAKGSASAWIFGVARNVAADLARARRRRPVPSPDVPDEEERAPWDEEDAWKAWEVGKAIRTLPPEQQKVIELAYVYQFTHSEIARALSIPLGTVKTRISSALTKLQRLLAQTGVVEERVP